MRSGGWERADMLALFGHHDKADALRDRYASEQAQHLLDKLTKEKALDKPAP